jgi:hypothetical protein
MEKVGGKYKYYAGCGVYRTDGKKVEFYEGDGKWGDVDYDIKNALKFDDNFAEIGDQSELDFFIEDWDSEK